MPRTLKQLVRLLINLCFYRTLKKRFNNYNHFSKKHLCVSAKKYTTLEELKKFAHNYDILISGSDQVWNIKAHDADKAYFLPFEEKSIKKIAYAVSLGGTNLCTATDVEEYARYINNFSTISVREKNAKKWMQEITDIPIEIMADPTLLLEKKDYFPLCTNSGINEKYIFWYTTTYTTEAVTYIKKISTKLKLPIYIINAKEWTRRGLFRHGIKLAPNGGPGSYLSCIRNAELVLTSSFHGTIFSVMFEKNFWYLETNTSSDDDRASFLLDQLALSNRAIGLNKIPKLDFEDKPSYNIATRKIEDLKIKSLMFIENNIAKT
jgi:hypothetical protein